MALLRPVSKGYLSTAAYYSSHSSQASLSELERLRQENRDLKKRLAEVICLYIWLEGGSYSKMEAEIRQYGYHLLQGSEGLTPRVEPLPSVTS